MKLIGFLMTLSLSLHAVDSSYINEWNKTKLSEDKLSFFINSKDCFIKAIALFSCKKALDYGLKSAELSYQIIPHTLLKKQNIIFSSKHWLIVEESLDFSIQNEKKLFQHFESNFKRLNHSASQEDFNLMLSWVLLLLKSNKPQNIQYVFSVILNQYFSSVSSPHNTIIPTSYYQNKVSDEKFLINDFGLELKKEAGKFLVTDVSENSEAHLRGIKKGDTIMSLNKIKLLDTHQLKDIHSFIDSKLIFNHISVLMPETKKEENIKLYNQSQVTFKVIPFINKKWLYISLKSFHQNACDFIDQKLNYDVDYYDAYILDLRNNPGGDIMEAYCIASIFLDSNKTVMNTIKLSDFQQQNLKTPLETSHPSQKIKMVTLVNAHSASSSEILAAALKENDRSFIIGERTYGKGSIQEVKQWPHAEIPQSILLLETAHYFFSPLGNPIQNYGVKPDFVTQVSHLMREEDTYYNAPLFPNPQHQAKRKKNIGLLKNCAQKKLIHKPYLNDRTLDKSMSFSVALLQCF